MQYTIIFYKITMTLMIQGFQVNKVGYIYQSSWEKHIMLINTRQRYKHEFTKWTHFKSINTKIDTVKLLKLTRVFIKNIFIT